jgi:hypothetical protein
VIGADDDDRRVAFHHSPRRAEPAAREGIVGGEIGELVPVVVDRVDKALVGARERAFELKILRGIGEDEVDARLGQGVQLGDAVADEDDVARRRSNRRRLSRQAGPSTQNLKLGREARRTGTRGTHRRNHSTRLSGQIGWTRWLCRILGKRRVMPAGPPLCRFCTIRELEKTKRINIF